MQSEPIMSQDALPENRPAKPEPVTQPSAIAPESHSAPPPRVSLRLESLDAFRGLTILGMLLVNNVALDTATPKHLTHAPWNQGVHFADLVFPWFLLIVGVAIPFAFSSRRRKSISAAQYAGKVLGRAVWLFLLGLLIDSSLAKQPVFDLGVLQLIGLAYLVGALLYSLPVSPRLSLAALFLIGHWAAIRFVPVPGAGAGVFLENQNLINHLNQAYLAPLHLQGIISLVPASALVLIGTAGGDLLRSETRAPEQKAGWLLVSGLLLMGLGWGWSLDLPFNKSVWTASYILFTAGLGGVALGFMYLLIDGKHRRAWAFPLIVPGRNAILAYVLPILVKLYILQQWTWQNPAGVKLSLQAAFLQFCITHTGRIAGGWLYTLTYIGIWWLVLLYFYRKRIFLRV
jgi:predicted acyltransferase